MNSQKLRSWPDYSREEIDAVVQVLESNRVNYWTGDEGRKFESEFASWCGVRHGIAVTNGTLALELALRGLGLGPGDEVVVTPRSFIASVSSVVQVGATPVFADIDPDSQNITADTVRAVCTNKTKAVICVHLAGWPCDMTAFRKLADELGIFLVEDCAQAHGAKHRGKPVGGWGDVAAWSFCQDKIMTTGGEGGMVTTDDEGLWRKMWAYKDHGKSYHAVYEREHASGFRWLHESFGSNYRMLEIQAAIGRIQLRYMPEWHARRTTFANRIAAAFADIPGLRIPVPKPEDTHAWYKFCCFVKPEMLADGWNRNRIMDSINDECIPCFSGSCSEIYREKAFDGTPWRPTSPLPVAHELGETALMFLVHPTLKEADIDRTIEVVRQVMLMASGCAPSNSQA